MTATTTTGVIPIDSAPAASSIRAVSTSSTRAVSSRRRRISPEAGHALEILGHSIDYLIDEFIFAGGSLSTHDPRFEAVQLLMAANREIYFACPEVPTLAQRCRSLLHLQRT